MITEEKKMKKNIYEAPEAKILDVDTVDVITISLPTFTDDNILGDGWIEA